MFIGESQMPLNPDLKVHQGIPVEKQSPPLVITTNLSFPKKGHCYVYLLKTVYQWFQSFLSRVHPVP